MTLHRMTSYREAIDRSRNNPYSEWPERETSTRLEPVASPSFHSGVSLQPGAKVVTMGSCFARNIEEYFEAEGFDVPLMGYTGPVEEFGQGGRVQGILNKYTLASIAIEIEWLAKVKAEGGIVTWDNVHHMLMELGPDRLLDMQLSTAVPVSRDRAIERRQQIYDIHVQIFDCDLAVLTPGLTETWFDTKTGYYIQRVPGPRQAKADPDRFKFGVMDFFQCHEMLDRTIRILKENGTRQIALTVSPVPLHRTMTEQDVLIANTYSKSTLRAVVGMICERHDDVFYVPSYERVMLSKDESVWRPDLRHVADEFVGTIASSFAAAALGRPLQHGPHAGLRARRAGRPARRCRHRARFPRRQGSGSLDLQLREIGLPPADGARSLDRCSALRRAARSAQAAQPHRLQAAIPDPQQARSARRGWQSFRSCYGQLQSDFPRRLPGPRDP